MSRDLGELAFNSSPPGFSKDVSRVIRDLNLGLEQNRSSQCLRPQASSSLSDQQPITAPAILTLVSTGR